MSPSVPLPAASVVCWTGRKNRRGRHRSARENESCVAVPDFRRGKSKCLCIGILVTVPIFQAIEGERLVVNGCK